MACPQLPKRDCKFSVTREKINSKSLRIFRHISRTVSGESLEPALSDIILFGRTLSFTKNSNDVVGVCCGRPQKMYFADDVNDEELFHWINFLFVLKEYQGNNLGKLMLKEMENALWFGSPANIRVKSATKAVGFFQKIGYSKVGPPIDCLHSGSALFKTLHVMEKEFVQSE